MGRRGGAGSWDSSIGWLEPLQGPADQRLGRLLCWALKGRQPQLEKVVGEFLAEAFHHLLLFFDYAQRLSSIKRCSTKTLSHSESATQDPA